MQRLEKQRAKVIASLTQCLAAAHEAEMVMGGTDVAHLAQKHGVDSVTLAEWLEYLALVRQVK